MYGNFNKEREDKTMKYEAPKMTALTPAIDAIQMGSKLHITPYFDAVTREFTEEEGAYADWE